jgi:hypothetical protein
MAMEIQEHVQRYTAQCAHCARTVFRDARRIGDFQLTMIEIHLLVCRPLVMIAHATDLLAHCKVTERAL